ncbi:dihydrolipoyl dehydrogenase [Rhizobium sp. FKY42]|uniref:dihydrolipoyl dehydrogenase n=1 Tax=Rhizobium sp. FKY42 TaxID=2562310 RepID=UPI0010C03292|nr:dihydrolipoyl dehydrogenase [Rhizobium sp. FKY42]
MTDLSCKVLVLGAGPGGYVCAIRAGQAGLDTIIVEKAAPGGTCLNVGCIPSKALIHAAEQFHTVAHAATGHSALGILTSSPKIDLAKTMSWKDGIVRQLTGGVSGLLRKAGVRKVDGEARILDGKTVEVQTADGLLRISCEHLVIASGSVPIEVPSLPFGGDILSSTEALSLETVPETLAVVGGGYIGLEIGTAYAKLGAQVTILEARPQILPQYDSELSRPVQARLKALGVEVHLNAQASLYANGVLQVKTSDGDLVVPAQKVLVTVGRRPVIADCGADSLGLDMQGRYIKINGKCQTSMREVYAIGDVTGEPMLAHRAMAQGEIAAAMIAGEAASWEKRAIPAVCFTDPEIVVVGHLPDEARAANADAAVATYPLRANGRAMTLERTDGFVRIVHEKKSGLVLGIQAVGAGVSEFAGEFALALEMCATLTDIAATIHAHPTLGETVQEAAWAGLGKALHA